MIWDYATSLVSFQILFNVSWRIFYCIFIACLIISHFIAYFCSFFIFVCVCVFYVLPFGVINDDDSTVAAV